MGRLLSKEDVRNILANRFKDDTCKSLGQMPSPKSFKDISKASSRIVEAINNNESIVIVGDYDVDGVVSSVILSEFFDDIDVSYSLIIPNRFSDGYGLNPEIVKKVDANVIITVDNGISAVEAAQHCKEKGIDLIITDHHTVPSEVPDAYAIVNPKQDDCDFPNCEICGAQVAWYLVAALKEKLGLKTYDLSKFLDLLSVAIIADMMELKDMNRVMVLRGIKALNCSNRIPFIAIKEYFGKDILEGDDISFLIAPLINSSGRMEDAIYSYEFLKSTNLEDAMDKLEYIVHLNNSRKDEEKALFEASLEQISDDENIIVVWGEDWHEGVIGIVASRLSKKFKKPAIVFSIKDDFAKGSARSVGEIDILSLIQSQEDLLLGFGGHKGAAGVALKKEMLPKFKSQMIKACENLTPKELEAGSDVLGELCLKDIDFELLEILEEFEPYGQKNPKPNFILKDAMVKVDKIIGRDGRHLKLILQKENHSIESLFFNYDVDIRRGDRVELVFSVSKNTYRGLVTPQLLIKQISIV
ncbi:single-stranded-DNA-specific exonuclease RecJ [Sulfurospirillum sp. 1307]|jgi:single-stranded-DNA-specific exonuclease